MSRPAQTVLLVVAMIAIIVAVDVLFLRDRFWWRLAVNIGIVAVSFIIYAVFVRD